jgi:hypothetical protein
LAGSAGTHAAVFAALPTVTLRNAGRLTNAIWLAGLARRTVDSRTHAATRIWRSNAASRTDIVATSRRRTADTLVGASIEHADAVVNVWTVVVASALTFADDRRRTADTLVGASIEHADAVVNVWTVVVASALTFADDRR